jgi:transposase
LDNVTENSIHSLGVTLHEVNAALAREARRRVRKRLVAMGVLLTGQSIQRAAAAANTTVKCVECWLQRVRQAGFPSLLRDRRRRPSRRELGPAEVHEARRVIAAALERPLQHQIRTRLLACDMVLSGRAVEDAAAQAVVMPRTVQQWVRLVTRAGVGVALAKWEAPAQTKPRPELDADPLSLRELAAKETKPPRRKQMLALAFVAEGMSPHAAALAAGASHHTVYKRLERFRKEGTAAFFDMERWRTKLTPDQIQQLGAEIRTRPDITYLELQELVAARFGVHYSVDGLQVLLKRDLGIVRRERTFVETAAQCTPVNNLAQERDAATLHAALVRARDARAKRKLIALLHLAQGWEPARVALQVGASPEMLERWTHLYRRFGVEGVCGRRARRKKEFTNSSPNNATC